MGSDHNSGVIVPAASGVHAVDTVFFCLCIRRILCLRCPVFGVVIAFGVFDAF